MRGFDLAPQAPPRQLPCDKTRKIFTESWGVISDGPMGSNYTQDSHCEWLIKGKILMFHSFQNQVFRISGWPLDRKTVK